MANDFNEYYFGGQTPGGNAAGGRSAPSWMLRKLSELGSQLSGGNPEGYDTWNSDRKAEYRKSIQSAQKEFRDLSIGVNMFRSGMTPNFKAGPNGTISLDLPGSNPSGSGPTPIAPPQRGPWMPGGGPQPKNNYGDQLKANQAYIDYLNGVRGIQDKFDNNAFLGQDVTRPELLGFEDWLGYEGKDGGSEWAEFFPDDYFDTNGGPTWGTKGDSGYSGIGHGGVSTTSPGSSLGGGGNFGPGTIGQQPGYNNWGPGSNQDKSAMSGQYGGTPGTVLSSGASSGGNSAPAKSSNSIPPPPGSTSSVWNEPGNPPNTEWPSDGPKIPSPDQPATGSSRSDRVGGKGGLFNGPSSIYGGATSPKPKPMGINEIFKRNRANDPLLPGPTEPGYYSNTDDQIAPPVLPPNAPPGSTVSWTTRDPKTGPKLGIGKRSTAPLPSDEDILF